MIEKWLPVHERDRECEREGVSERETKMNIFH